MHGDRVLFLDGEALVIDKPAGLPVDPPRDGSLSLENHLDSLTLRLPALAAAGAPARPRHQRLPAARAQSQGACAASPQAFERGAVEKTYLAVLDGVPEATSGTIDLALARSARPRAAGGWSPTRRARRRAPRGELLAVTDGRALVALHARDRADAPDPRPCRRPGWVRRWSAIRSMGAADRGGMLLHAAELVVPRDGKPPIEADAPLPERFACGFAPEPTVPDDAIEERFLAATGPGGQNVNKVATACQLRVDVFALGLHPETYRAAEAARRLAADGDRDAGADCAPLPDAGAEPGRRARRGWPSCSPRRRSARRGG